MCTADQNMVGYNHPLGEKVKAKAKDGPLNLPIDQPDPTGCGGNTDTGINQYLNDFYSYFFSKSKLEIRLKYLL